MAKEKEVPLTDVGDDREVADVIGLKVGKIEAKLRRDEGLSKSALLLREVGHRDGETSA